VATGSDDRVYECTEEWEDLLQTLGDIAFNSCPCVENCGTGGTGGSGGTGGTGGSGGGAGTGGSGGSLVPTHCVDYTLFSTECFPEPQFRKGVRIDIQGSSITYTMTVRGLPTMATTQDPSRFDFHPYAAGTLSGMTATGAGEFITGKGSASPFPVCAAPEARLSFDIDFDDGTRDTYEGTINFDFTLDPSCGSSICFASANVKGCPCPGPCSQ